MGKERKQSGPSAIKAWLLYGTLLTALMTTLFLASISLAGATLPAPVPSIPAIPAIGSIPVQAPLNPEFLDYQAQPSNLGLIPATVDFSAIAQPMEVQDAAAIPSQYDLRKLGKVTPVKDQGSSGCCWAFATYGSLESTLLVSMDQTMDLSENNLKNTAGFDWGPNSGGNDMMSTAYLTRWSGPVNESSDPYNPSSTTSPTNLPVVKHVQNVYFVPAKTSPTNLATIKSAIMAYGAMFSTIYWDSSYYQSSTHSYYTPSSNGNSPNHAITIVGWDDNYSASNFSTRPPGNGAFIVKNSWGTSWGAGGYFYVSYYDKNIGTDNAIFTAQNTTNYNYIYQYDPLGWVGSFGYNSPTGWFENKFQATSGQDLAAVGFYIPQAGSSYQIYVLNGSTNVTAAYTVGSKSMPGYYTIPLNSKVYVPKGGSFTIRVKLTTPGYDYPISVEYPVSGYSSAAKASPGQSYISSNGLTWTDATSVEANMNVCLKAYADKV
jgi:C1A family cysteine protease